MIDLFEKIFSSIDESATLIQNEKEITYLEALIYVGDILFGSEEAEPILSDINWKRVLQSLSQISLDKISNEEVRKTFQLAILKGMREATQPHHAMTPDAVSVFIAYLVSKVMGVTKGTTILDPAVGSGNLLMAVLNQLPSKTVGFGIEPDEVLLQLACVNANLQKHHVEFFHQDCLTDIFIDPVDAVVTDLPVGYYPNQDVAKNYKLSAHNGMSYTHHLIIEQSLKYTKNGGFLFFLIPNNMFESEQASQLHSFLKENVVIYSLMQLPKAMFKNEAHAKSILIIRKKDDGLKVPSQALLCDLPSFSNKTAMADMIKKINEWFETYIQ